MRWMIENPRAGYGNIAMSGFAIRLSRGVAARAILIGLCIGLAGMAVALTAGAQSAWRAPPEANGYKNLIAPSGKSVAAGKKVYDKYCYFCHGDSGRGDGPSAKVLQIQTASFRDKKLMNQSDGSLAWKILNGRGLMPTWAPVLSEDDVWNVINYIRGFSK